MIREDYIMRIIHEMVRTLLKLLFHIDEEKKEEINFENEQLQQAYRDLMQLTREKRLEEAENLLYDTMQEGMEGFQLALLFYDRLNMLSEEELEAGGFSREEISDGILAAAKRYGYESMVSALLEKE